MTRQVAAHTTKADYKYRPKDIPHPFTCAINQLQKASTWYLTSSFTNARSNSRSILSRLAARAYRFDKAIASFENSKEKTEQWFEH